MTFALRPYQADLLHAIRPGGRTLIQLETGAGKTRIAVEWARLRQPTAERPLWFIVHKVELVDQAWKAFVEAGFDPGAIAHGETTTPGAHIQIATIQSLLYRDLSGYVPPAFICLDEAHHAPATSWRTLLERFSKVEVLGLTATPCRQDRKPLGRFFKTLLQGPPMRALQEQGHLSQFVYYDGVNPDLSDITILSGDYNRSQLGAVAEATLLTARPWEQWNQHALRGPALLFAPTIGSSEAAAEYFSREGVRATHVDFETPAKERKMILEGWKNGCGPQLICNIELFIEGLDCPHIDAVFLLRPTMSTNIYRQMVGRGLRPSLKGAVKIFDHAGCARMHGLPAAEIDWNLTKRMEMQEGAPRKARTCVDCGAFFTGGRTCPHCGHFHETNAGEVAVAAGFMEVLSGPPEGCVSIAEYARMKRLSTHSIHVKKRLGLPIRDGWIDVIVADDWLSDRKRAVAAANAERLRRLHDDPKFVAAHEEGLRQHNSDPKSAAASAERLRRLHADPEWAAASAEHARQRMRHFHAERRAKLAASGVEETRADPAVLPPNASSAT